MFADEFPAGGCAMKDTGVADAAERAADEIEVDDSVQAIVGELGKGETEDGSCADFNGSGDDRISLVAGDANGFL